MRRISDYIIYWGNPHQIIQTPPKTFNQPTQTYLNNALSIKTMPKLKTLKIKSISDNPSVNLSLDTISIGKQALVFVNTKRGAEKQAEEIAKKIKIDTNDPLQRKAREKLEQLSEEIIKSLSKPTRQCSRLAFCMKKGIAFHHAGLARKQKTLIEDAFRQNLVKIICCTPTLAAGVDLPAFRAIIRDLKRFGLHGLSHIPVLEYEQMSGRAGRPKYDSYGEAIAIASTIKEKEKIEELYINGEVEDIQSKLAVEPVLRTYVLSLIASEFVETEKELLDFFGQTFWAFQFEDMAKLEKIIYKMIKLLSDYDFIITDDKAEDFTLASTLKKGKLKATPIGKRVAQLYIDPLTAHSIITAIQLAETKTVSDFSLVHMVSTSLELRPLLRVKTSEYEEISAEIDDKELEFIVPEPTIYDHDYDHFLNSIKTALFFRDWCNENDEEVLLEKYNIRPGEIKVKLDLADWLL